MRSTVIGLIVVLVLTAALCTLPLVLARHVTEEIETMRLGVVEMVKSNRNEEAVMRLQQMDETWERYEPKMEMLVSHNSLGDVSKLIAEAHIMLEVGDANDFLRCMSVMGEIISNIWREEQFGLSNLL